MTDRVINAGDRQPVGLPDSLAIFSYAWAAQSLVQLVFFRAWLENGLILGWVFAFLTVAVFLFPGRLWLFAAMIVSSVAYYLSIWPFVVNHVFIDTIMSFGILGALAYTLVRKPGVSKAEARSETEAWFLKFAPVCGAIFAFMYFSIIVSKINVGFFDLDISCMTGMVEEAREDRPLVRELLTFFDVKFLFWVFIVAETALPIMLAVRQTRSVAFYFGVPFHVLLGLMGHWPFSAFMISLYVLVAMPAFKDVVQGVFAWLDTLRKKHIPWAPGTIVFAVGNALLLGSVVVLKPSWIWLLWTVTISAGMMYAVLREHIRHGFLAGTGVTDFWTKRPGWIWAVFVLAVVNSLSPYIGFKTESNVAMYSNMRTEGGVNNHYFMPVVNLFGFQNDLVEIIDSNNEEVLKLKTYPARYGFVGQEFEVYTTYFEMRRVVSGIDDDDLEITYLRNGEPRVFRRGTPDNVDANLDVAPPLFFAKIAHFRPVFKGEISYCLH